MELTLPEWLQGNLIDTGPGAYDALEPELRSKLKTQIAFLYDYWGERREDLAQRASWLDRVVCDEDRPVDWSLFLFDQVYASAPGMLAALMPAILAKSAEILTCRVGGGADSSLKSAFAEEALPGNRFGELALPVSAAFELAGQEQVWDLDVQEAVRLLAALDTQGGPGSGRVIILGSAARQQAASWMSEVIWSALQRNIPCIPLPGRVKIAVDRACAADFELLRWAHPQADIYSVEHAARLEPCNALVAESPADFYGRRLYGEGSAAEAPGQGKNLVPQAEESIPPPLCLQPGNEAFWAWPDLAPDFFRKRRLGIFNRGK